jgi:hypothetical protein
MFLGSTMRLPFLSVRRTFCLGAITSVLLYSTSAIVFDQSPAIAAEKVVLKYGIFRGSVPVSELKDFAETGKASPALQFYLKATRRDPQEVRQALTQEVKVNPLLLSRVLNSQAGEGLLDQVSQVVHTPSGQSDHQALRSALILSAAEDGKITLIEAMQNYPTSEVQVEGKRLVLASRQLSTFGGRIQDLLGGRKLF